MERINNTTMLGVCIPSDDIMVTLLTARHPIHCTDNIAVALLLTLQHIQ